MAADPASVPLDAQIRNCRNSLGRKGDRRRFYLERHMRFSKMVRRPHPPLVPHDAPLRRAPGVRAGRRLLADRARQPVPVLLRARAARRHGGHGPRGRARHRPLPGPRRGDGPLEPQRRRHPERRGPGGLRVARAAPRPPGPPRRRRRPAHAPRPHAQGRAPDGPGDVHRLGQVGGRPRARRARPVRDAGRPRHRRLPGAAAPEPVQPRQVQHQVGRGLGHRRLHGGRRRGHLRRDDPRRRERPARGRQRRGALAARAGGARRGRPAAGAAGAGGAGAPRCATRASPTAHSPPLHASAFRRLGALEVEGRAACAYWSNVSIARNSIIARPRASYAGPAGGTARTAEGLTSLRRSRPFPSGCCRGTPNRSSTHERSGRMARRGMGWIPDRPDFRDFTADCEAVCKCKKPTAAGAALPAEADLRKWCSPIEDQADLGSCTAHAAVALVEYCERRASGRHIDASRLFVYKTTRRLARLHGDSGADLRNAMGALVLFGAPPEEHWPYDTAAFDKEPTAFCYAFGQPFQAIKYYRLDPPGARPEATLRALKQELARGYPAMFGFTVYTSIDDAGADGAIPFPTEGERIDGGHAGVAVGYADAKEISGQQGAPLVRNSWGAGGGG